MSLCLCLLVRALAGKRRYNIKLWKTFTDCFNCLPVAAVIDEKILCMHGGLSPDLTSLEEIKNIGRPTDVPGTSASARKVRSCQVGRRLGEWVCRGDWLSGPPRLGLRGLNWSMCLPSWCARYGFAVRPAVGGPGQGYCGVGGERPGRVLHLWGGHRGQLPQGPRPRPHLQSTPGTYVRACLRAHSRGARPLAVANPWCSTMQPTEAVISGACSSFLVCFDGPSGCGGRVRVLRKTAAGDHLLGAQLLRRVRQRRRHDERRRLAHVLLPGKAVTGPPHCLPPPS